MMQHLRRVRNSLGDGQTQAELIVGHAAYPGASSNASAIPVASLKVEQNQDSHFCSDSRFVVVACAYHHDRLVFALTL